MLRVQESNAKETGVLVNPLDLHVLGGSDGDAVLVPFYVQGAISLSDGADHSKTLSAGQVLGKRERLDQGSDFTVRKWEKSSERKKRCAVGRNVCVRAVVLLRQIKVVRETCACARYKK